MENLMQQATSFIQEMEGPSLPHIYEEEDVIDGFVSGLNNAQVQVAGPEQVFGALYDRIGYGAIRNSMFRNIVICRLFNPGSKMKTTDYMERYLHVTYSVDQTYRFLDNLCYRKEEEENRNRGSKAGVGKDGEQPESTAPATPKPDDFKPRIENIAYSYTKKMVGDNISVCFYDMTTLYFEAAEEDDLCKCGFSKDGKHSCPQIFLGLLVASGGNPIGYEIYEGNISEGHTMIPLIRKLASRFGFDKPIVVADAGLLSKTNIEELTKDGYQYIIGARPKSESDKVKEQILSLGMKYGDVVEIKKDGDVRLVLSCTEKRAKKDAHNRHRGLTRLQKRMASGRLTKQNINNRGYNKYLKMEGEVTISINMEKYEADAACDGIKGYVTNTSLAKDEVIANYSNLWFIERAFRMNKFDLAVRPIYHRLRNRIEGHICCFTAYTIMLELERILKAAKSEITIYRAQEIVKNMYAITYTLPRSKQTKRVHLGMNEEQSELCRLVVPGWRQGT
ncbi:MAG: IS1634 family transposase [Prevotella sp.]|nr:IS1634 family transposase [Prevotella sp.]